jgi:hypothetical protein
MQRAAVHIFVYATCCSKIKRDASAQSASIQPEDSEGAPSQFAATEDDSSEGGTDDPARVSR